MNIGEKIKDGDLRYYDLLSEFESKKFGRVEIFRCIDPYDRTILITVDSIYRQLQLDEEDVIGYLCNMLQNT